MTKATPGPWYATTRRGSWDYVVASAADPNIEICQMFHDDTDENETGEANAALVAAAPDLRDAAAEVLGLMTDTAKQDSGAYLAFQRLEAAVKKATI